MRIFFLPGSAFGCFISHPRTRDEDPVVYLVSGKQRHLEGPIWNRARPDRFLLSVEKLNSMSGERLLD